MRKRRGFALLTAAAMMAVLMGVIAGLMYFASRWRGRSISLARAVSRQACAESGLQLAKAYFGQNYVNWNQFLSNPGVYNPIPITRGGARPTADPIRNLAAITAVDSNVVADLDGDGQPDVYIYIRDNEDEYVNAQPNNPLRDNDQMVIVGSMCISKTMVPRREDGTLGLNGIPEPIVVEALLQFVDKTQLSGAQLNQGTFGNGNAN
jgi:hypothetical protein